VICNSDRSVRDVIQRVGVEPRRVRRVYYGIDAGRFGDQDDVTAAKAALGLNVSVPLVLFVGALGDRRKGFDTLYAAWKAMSRSAGWNAHLLVAGTGAELNRWRAVVERDGLSRDITFLGYRTDIPRLIAAADLMVHPARYEAYGLAVHEAICAGVPAIVSRSAGIAERFPDDLTALLVDDAESAADLCTRLRRWASAPNEFQSRAHRFGRELRTRGWDDMAREIVAASQA
jgi:glycosyltransferase involved in cell wall biosynthesis